THPAWATFHFGKGGLERVEVRPKAESAALCRDLAEALEEKYGKPSKKSLSGPGAEIWTLEGAWESGDTMIGLSCSSITTGAALAKMKKARPDAALPDTLPADAVRLEYRRKR